MCLLVDVLIEGKKGKRKGIELRVSVVRIVIEPLTWSSGDLMIYTSVI
jgi:hypothetical protein